MNKIIWSVVVSSHNSDDRIYDVVSMIDKCSHETKAIGEVIIVDDHSRKPVLKSNFKVRKINIVVIRNNINIGQSKSENLGARKAHGNLLFFLNDDCVPVDKLFIKSTVDLYKKKHLVIAGYITTKANRFMIESIRFPKSITINSKSVEYCNLQGGCFAIDKSLFQKVNGFSENLSYLQDIDLAYKLENTGAKIIFNEHLWAEHYDKKITLANELLKTYKAYFTSFKLISEKFPSKVKDFYWAEVFSRREQWVDKYFYSEYSFLFVYYIYRIIYPLVPRFISIEIYNYLQRCMIFYALRAKESVRVLKVIG